MTFDPKLETDAFRIWCFCQPKEWDVTHRDICDHTDLTMNRVRSIMMRKRWHQRVRVTQPAEYYADVGMRDSRSQLPDYQSA